MKGPNMAREGRKRKEEKSVLPQAVFFLLACYPAVVVHALFSFL